MRTQMNQINHEEVVAYIDGKYTESDTGCWLWSKSKDMNGYSVGSLINPATGKKKAVNQFHRHVYMAYKGEIKSCSPIIRHTCNNRNCINPDHLIAGTSRQNTQDAINDNTHASLLSTKGQRRRRFNDHQRADIRSRIAAGETYYSIAKYYRTLMSVIHGYARRDAAKFAATQTTPFSPLQLEELYQRFGDGEKGIDLAAYYGVSTSTISYYKNKWKNLDKN